jgi:hypothetical protein
MGWGLIPTLIMLFLWAGDSSPHFQCFSYGLGTHPHISNAFLMGWGLIPTFPMLFLWLGMSSPLLPCFSYGWGCHPHSYNAFLMGWGCHPHSYHAFLMAGDINIECGDGWGQLYPSPLCNVFLMGDFIPTSSPLFQCFSYGVGIK